MSAAPMVIASCPGDQEFRLSKGDWSMTAPLDDFANWVRLYRRLRDRDGGRFAPHFVQPVAALEGFARDKGIALPPAPVAAIAPVAGGRRK